MERKLRQVYRSTLCLTATLLSLSFVLAIDFANAEPEPVPSGRELAHSYDHGNCLACHSAPTDKNAITLANIAPPFMDMKRRFPSKDKLFKQIWDARDTHPETIMPPFGAHSILSETEIRRIIDYLYTL